MQTVLVTGGNSGIGLEIALKFAREGYRVYAAARRPEIVGDHANVITISLDVNDDESVKACIATVGAVDVLVNNAGIGGAGTVEMIPMAKIRELFETNFFGAVRMMQAVLPGMRERRSGTVVNITSVMGHMTLPGHAFYAATKFALGVVSEALAAEVRPFGIQVAIIEPGVTLTPIWGKAEYSMPPEHPYTQAMDRLSRLFEVQLDGATMPDAIAEATYEAVATGSTKLRYPVGADSEVMAAARDRMTAAEWMELLTIEENEQFFTEAEKAFGADLYHPPSLNQRRSNSAS